MFDRIAAMGDAMLSLVVPRAQAEAQSYICGHCQCRLTAPSGACVLKGKVCCTSATTDCWWASC